MRKLPEYSLVLGTVLTLLLTTITRAKGLYSPLAPVLIVFPIGAALTYDWTVAESLLLLITLFPLLVSLAVTKITASAVLPLGAHALVLCGAALAGSLYTRQWKVRQQQLTRQLQDAGDLLDVSLWISTSNSLEDAVDIVLPALKRMHSYRAAVLYLVEENQRCFVAHAADGAAEHLKFSRLPLSVVGMHISGQGYSTIYAAEADAVPQAPIASLLPGMRSCIFIPIVLPGNQLTGALFLGYDTPDALTESVRDRLKDFAMRIAFPLQKTRMHEHLQGLAFSDGLTGLLNHRAFRMHLDEEVVRAARYNHPLSIIMLDIDYFKVVNDTYGHPAGDYVLAQLAAVLRSSLRSSDIPARYGGEEFMALCPETDLQHAAVVAERIRASVENMTLKLNADDQLTAMERIRLAVEDAPTAFDQETEVRITVSIGVAAYPGDAADQTTLIKQVDIALYQAKSAGRNRVVCAAHLRNPEERPSAGPPGVSDVEWSDATQRF